MVNSKPQYVNYIVKRGDYGDHIIEIQKGLNAKGFWPLYVPYSKKFGPTTDTAVRKFQAANGLVVDGKVGRETVKLLGIPEHVGTGFDTKWKDVVIEGAEFPDAPVLYNVRVKLNREILEEYMPVASRVMSGYHRGFLLLITIMAYKEGFRKGTRSYNTNNPGNIGNVDSGKNHVCASLTEGVARQRNYILDIVDGKHSRYPMGKEVTLNPYYSKEIAKNAHVYGMSPHLPGYHFIFNGSLEQFVKIYATGSRLGNGYLSMICTYFKMNGLHITPKSKIQDIILMD